MIYVSVYEHHIHATFKLRALILIRGYLGILPLPRYVRSTSIPQ